MIDLTRSEFGIPVVRIVIPGLEGAHKVPGYIPGVRAQLALRSNGG
jgi:ribosomal protein S12 methylthiotransferase accessory factor YcaO